MKNYIQHHPWKIIENQYHPQWNKVTESLCSLGNGYMGHRGNFEEEFSGSTLEGSYLAGIYYPDKTRVGWWKNGYPEYFAKVLNSVNWIGIDVELDGESLDLAKADIKSFSRELDMQKGILVRKVLITTTKGDVEIKSIRFCSISRREVGALKYSITSKGFEGKVCLSPYLDFDVRNQDANYDEDFWLGKGQEFKKGRSFITAETKKTLYLVCAGLQCEVSMNNIPLQSKENIVKEKYLAQRYEATISNGDTISTTKIAAITTSENHPKEELQSTTNQILEKASSAGFDALLNEQVEAWAKKWEESDIKIIGDIAAQQGIRFNIFQLNQTYTGEDERLNIGPKGFTGEKYGGSTYWDTEAYCIPFYLATANEKVAKNLLVYRHRHLQKAIENAQKLGFNSGAALYPMVTMTGEECHNEWEITFEEIHRNGAIAYAIHDYIRYTGDKKHLSEHGLEVLIAIARFWAQRVNYSNAKQKYVILGVTGPNEYENNVNNNWYTNYMAKWCMQFAWQSVEWVRENFPKEYERITKTTSFKEQKETNNWKEIAENMYFPYDEEREVFLQQDGFLDKELIPMSDIPEGQYPIHKNWSWDRILRSCYIKQADTLQGLYFFEENFDIETIQRNFYFYEPMTVHESSLSPCVHTILAAKIGDYDKAYEMYLRTARLDIDDYNHDTEDGLHITSMGGTWMSFVKGFAGMRVINEQLHFNPFIPEQWQGYSFKIRFRNNLLKISANTNEVQISNESKKDISLQVLGKTICIAGKSTQSVHLKEKANVG